MNDLLPESCHSSSVEVHSFGASRRVPEGDSKGA